MTYNKNDVKDTIYWALVIFGSLYLFTIGGALCDKYLNKKKDNK